MPMDMSGVGVWVGFIMEKISYRRNNHTGLNWWLLRGKDLMGWRDTLLSRGAVFFSDPLPILDFGGWNEQPIQRKSMVSIHTSQEKTAKKNTQTKPADPKQNPLTHLNPPVVQMPKGFSLRI